MCQKIGRDTSASSTLSLIQTLLKPEQIEHDVYGLFEKIMEYMWDWYYTSPRKSSPLPARLHENGNNTIEETPTLFDDNDRLSALESQMLSNSAKRLQNMWVNILQLHDKELYDHLVSLYVLPTTFGVNWTKLLFTRQFTDYFPLWDAVIVSNFSLVDYIVVAMVSITGEPKSSRSLKK